MSLFTEVLQALDGSEATIKELQDEIVQLKLENAELKQRSTEWANKALEVRQLYIELKANGKVPHEMYENERVAALQAKIQIRELEVEKYGLQREVRSLEQRLKIYEQAVGPDPGAASAEDLVEAQKAVNLMDYELDKLNLEVRTLTCLLRRGIATVSDVCGYSALELLDKVRGFGPRCLNDLNYRIGLLGLKLADEESPAKQRKAEELLLKSRAKLLTIEKMDLSEKTFAEAQAAGFQTAYDALTMTKNDVRQQFDSEACAEEFLEKMEDFDFSLK